MNIRVVRKKNLENDNFVITHVGSSPSQFLFSGIALPGQ